MPVALILGPEPVILRVIHVPVLPLSVPLILHPAARVAFSAGGITLGSTALPLVNHPHPIVPISVGLHKSANPTSEVSFPVATVI